MVILLLIVTALLWVITPIIEKIGLAKIDPLVGVTIRSTIVTVGLFILTFLLGKGKFAGSKEVGYSCSTLIPARNDGQRVGEQDLHQPGAEAGALL